MKKPTIEELNKIYRDAEEADREVFAEQRTNILLIAGEHYAKKQKNHPSRDSKLSSEPPKLKITKNFHHKIQRHYVSNILSYSPGVTIKPQRDNEIQDQKAAEMHRLVWDEAKNRYRLQEKVYEWCESFVGVGACAAKLFFDPNAGDFIGYEAKLQKDSEGQDLTDDFGNFLPEVDENGQLVPDETKPRFEGDIVWEDIDDFNLLFHVSGKGPKKSPVWIIRKMSDRAELEAMYSGDEEKLKAIKEGSDEEFVVFDSTKKAYEKSKDKILIREHYWQPCYTYPKGYFTISTDAGILEEGELPLGLFPIVWAGMDLLPTARRAKSIHKVARPFQAEINRGSSQAATHQVTVGDDKIIYQDGTKLVPGAMLPGIKGLKFQGAAPTILPGRAGDQFLPSIQNTKSEMYDALDMAEENEKSESGQFDAFASLMKSLKQQKKYSSYGKKFNQFLKDVCDLYLALAKEYISDERLINSVGLREAVNISEFRSATKLQYQITVEEQDETLETKFGRQLSINHVLQYVGPQLKPEDIGKMIKNLPFANMEEAFDDLTLDYDNVKNDMLALERGEYPEPGEYENHPYIINKLSNRTKQSDFKLLTPIIQANYKRKISEHIALEAERQEKIMAAKNQYLPTGGAMVACDLYVPNKEDPSKPAKRVRLPYQSLEWLVNQLEVQGQNLEKLEQMNQGALAELAGQYQSQFNNNGMPANSSSFSNATNPIGVS